jgi:hypothetical protein
MLGATCRFLALKPKPPHIFMTHFIQVFTSKNCTTITITIIIITIIITIITTITTITDLNAELAQLLQWGRASSARKASG